MAGFQPATFQTWVFLPSILMLECTHPFGAADSAHPIWTWGHRINVVQESHQSLSPGNCCGWPPARGVVPDCGARASMCRPAHQNRPCVVLPQTLRHATVELAHERQHRLAALHVQQSLRHGFPRDCVMLTRAVHTILVLGFASHKAWTACGTQSHPALVESAYW